MVQWLLTTTRRAQRQDRAPTGIARRDLFQTSLNHALKCRCTASVPPESGDGSSLRIAESVSAMLPRSNARRAEMKLVHHAAEGKNISAMIDGVAARLLRSHVADGSHHQARRCCRRSSPVGGGSDASRQPEVENLDVAVACDDDVCRLEIAVHDAAVVGGSERARDLRAVLQGLANGQRSPGDDIGERFSFEKLRDRCTRLRRHVRRRRSRGCWGGRYRPASSSRARSARAGSLANAGGRTFIATSRPRRASWAR